MSRLLSNVAVLPALVGAIAFTTAMSFTNQAHAQVSLDSLFNRGNVQTTGTVTPPKAAGGDTQTILENQIDERLKSIIERIGSPSRAPVAETLTVEELDRLRREAERADATRALRSAEFDEIQSELEMLTLLQTTLSEIKQDQTTAIAQTQQEAEPAVNVESLRAQWEAERAAEDAAAATQVEDEGVNIAALEQGVIPRLVTIKGAGGQFEAEIQSVMGVTQYVTPGDALADGFVLESIDPKGVVIKGQATGSRYSLIPSPPMDPEASTSREIPIAREVGATF
jgi:type IV pilus biogenesis protein PilP